MSKRGTSSLRGRDARTGPAHEDLPAPLLERLDALAHRRRRDVELPRGGVEAARAHHRGEGGQLGAVEVHISQANGAVGT